MRESSWLMVIKHTKACWRPGDCCETTNAGRPKQTSNHGAAVEKVDKKQGSRYAAVRTRNPEGHSRIPEKKMRADQTAPSPSIDMETGQVLQVGEKFSAERLPNNMHAYSGVTQHVSDPCSLSRLRLGASKSLRDVWSTHGMWPNRSAKKKIIVRSETREEPIFHERLSCGSRRTVVVTHGSYAAVR